MPAIKKHSLHGAVGLLLGSLAWVFLALVQPNELGFILYMVIPVLLYAGGLGFGFIGFLTTCIGFAIAGTIFNKSAALWVLSIVQFLVPLAILIGLFRLKVPVLGRRLTDEGVMITACIVIIVPVSMALCFFLYLMGHNPSAYIQDTIMVGMQQVRGHYGEGIIDPDVERALVLADMLIPVLKNTILGFLLFLWALWQYLCFKVAKSILKRAGRSADSAIEQRSEGKTYLWHSIALLVLLLVGIFPVPLLQFMVFNGATVLVLLYAFSGFRQLSDWIGARVYLRLGVLFLLYFLSIPMLILLILMGVGEQVKAAWSKIRKIGKRRQ